MLLFLTNRDSQHLFPENTATDFRVHLPLPIKGKFCALHQCYLPSKPTSTVFLKCDFVQSSIIDSKLQPILCMLVNKNTSFDNVHYVEMKPIEWTTLHLQFVNRQGEKIDTRNGDTSLVLEITDN